MNDSEKMKALVFDGPNRLNLREIPRPVPDEGEVLVQIRSAAICGSDVRIVSGRKTRDVRPGHPIGHECAGTVAAMGSGVRGYEVGQPVAVCVVVSCGDCEYCRTDKENLCENRITLGYHTDGAFAEYMLIPAHAVQRGNLFKLPHGVSLEVAPLLEPMACCINGQHEMELGESDGGGGLPSLVIFGAGPIGLLHLMLAKAKGIDPVTVVEPVEHRRDTACQLGADRVCSPDDFDGIEQFDAAILAVGASGLVDSALQTVRRCGKINLFAGFDTGSKATIDPNLIHYKQLHMTGASESRRRDFAEALSLVREGTIDPLPLVTHRFGLNEFQEAFRVASEASALKILFEISR